MTNQRSALAKPQSGVVLVISLIMLLALTIIGITSSSVTGLEEKMSANTKDINLAFQAAEMTLRNVEASLSTYPSGMTTMRTAAATAQGTGGLYTMLKIYATGAPLVLPKDTAPVQGTSSSCPNPKTFTPDYCVDWNTTGGSIRYATYPAVTGTPVLTGVARQPEYIIEELSSKSAGDGGGGSLEAGVPFITAPQAEIWFRITARGWGSNANSIATVQSIVLVTYDFCC